MLKIFAKDLKT